MDTESSITEPARKLLEAWSWRAKRAAFAHYQSARKLDRRHYIFGVLLVVSSVISTTLAGRSLFGVSGIWLDGLMTLFSILTLVIACLHVFLQDASRAERYRRAGARYAAIKREIEVLVMATNLESSVPADALSEIRVQLDKLGDEALPIPDAVWGPVDALAQQEKKSFKLSSLTKR